jgi:hypothetical protein
MHAPIIYDLSGIAPDTRELILATPKYRKLFTMLPEQMLRLDGSTKVIKGNKYGFRGQRHAYCGRVPQSRHGRGHAQQ